MTLTQEAIELKTAFEAKMKVLLAKVNPRINGNWLTITVTPPEEELVNLRSEFASLQTEHFVGCKVRFTLNKCNVKNSQNRYEIAELESPIVVETVLSLNHFQVNRQIKWTDSNGEEKEAVINNFQISLFRGFVETSDLVVETFELVN